MNALLAFVIVTLILIVVYLVFVYAKQANPDGFLSDNEKRKKSEKFYQKSDGTFDEEAETALNTINKIKKPTAEDNFRAGNILELNYSEGNANENTTEGVAARYRTTVDQIAVGEQRDVDPINVRFMLDHIVDFTERNIGEMAAGRRMQGRASTMQMPNHAQPAEAAEAVIIDGMPMITDDMFLDNMVAELIHMTHDATTVRKNVTENAAVSAGKISRNKKEFSSNFAKLSQSHTSDPQNVHDSSVRFDNQKTLDIIKKTASNKTPGEVIQEIRYHIDNYYDGNEIKKAQAHAVLSEVSKGQYIMTYNDNEARILKYVWDRAKIPENKDNEMDIKDSVVVALQQSLKKETGKPNCINGRVSNILGSLVILDCNKNVGAANTEEQYKNDMLRRAEQILDEELEKAKASGNKPMIQVAKSFFDDSSEVDEKYVEIFKTDVKKTIDEMVNSYRDKMSPRKLKEMKEDCYVCALVD